MHGNGLRVCLKLNSHQRHATANRATQTAPRKPWQQVRQVSIGAKPIELEHLEEAFTSEHWIVRVYKVLKPHNRF